MINPFKTKRKDGLPQDKILYKPADLSQRDQADISRAFARLFSGDDGKLVLSYLQSQTLDRALAASASDEQIRYSEGQRAIVTMITRLIDRGRRG